MAVDDYEYRTHSCVRTISQTYTPGGKGAEPIVLTRACDGMHQTRPVRLGGGKETPIDPWTCRLCNKPQTVTLVKAKVKL